MENKIREMLDEGKSRAYISKLLGCTEYRVRAVKGSMYKEYVNLGTGELERLSKTIPNDIQIFYILYEGVKREESKENKNILNIKSLNVRLADYLGINSRKTSRWLKKQKYVAPELLDIQECLVETYLYNREGTFRNNYYKVDDLGYVKGFKMYYYSYAKGKNFNYFINSVCIEYLMDNSFDVEVYKKKEKSKDIPPYIVDMSCMLGYQLYLWAKHKINEGYSVSNILSCLSHYESDREIELNMKLPKVIYYNTEGYEYIREEFKNKIKQQIVNEEVIGKFKDIQYMEVLILRGVRDFLEER